VAYDQSREVVDRSRTSRRVVTVHSRVPRGSPSRLPVPLDHEHCVANQVSLELFDAIDLRANTLPNLPRRQ
jgi:hypothetical protein